MIRTAVKTTATFKSNSRTSFLTKIRYNEKKTDIGIRITIAFIRLFFNGNPVEISKLTNKIPAIQIPNILGKIEFKISRRFNFKYKNALTYNTIKILENFMSLSLNSSN